jgi:hypothetical protein
MTQNLITKDRDSMAGLVKCIWLRALQAARVRGEVVVDDPLVGVFALHNEFDLLLKEDGSAWRPVGLDYGQRVAKHPPQFVVLEQRVF